MLVCWAHSTWLHTNMICMWLPSTESMEEIKRSVAKLKARVSVNFAAQRGLLQVFKSVALKLSVTLLKNNKKHINIRHF